MGRLYCATCSGALWRGKFSIKVSFFKCSVLYCTMLLYCVTGVFHAVVSLCQPYQSSSRVLPARSVQQYHSVSVWWFVFCLLRLGGGDCSGINGIYCPVWGWGTPLPPLSIYFLIFFSFHFFLCFINFTYFLLLSIPSLSTGIVPLRFQAGGRRRRPNLVLVCFLFCTLCYLYSLVKMYCGALFYLV